MKTILINKSKRSQIIKTPILYRDGPIIRAEMDEDSRELKLSFSSEEPVSRWFGSEILDHDKKSVDLSFLDSGRAPLLKDHNREIQTGVIEKAFIGKDRKGRAEVRFGKSAVAEEEFNDINDGIRSSVSVGYRINKMVLEESSDEDGDIYRAVDWTPLEVSIVSIPADQSVGVGRQGEDREFDTQVINKNIREGNIMPEKEIKLKAEADAKAKVEAEARAKKEAEARAEAQVKVLSDTRMNEVARVMDIMTLGNLHKMEKEAMEAVKNGASLDQFRKIILDKYGDPVAVAQGHGDDAIIGLSNKDIGKYSFVKVIRAIALGRNDPKYLEEAAFELECSRAASAISGQKPQGIMVPHDVLGSTYMSPQMVRALTAGTATAGAELVADNLLAGSFIDVLRNLAVVMSLNPTVLDGLVGDVLIPRKTAGSAGGWLATEGGDAGLSEATFDQVPLTPKTVGAYSEMTRQLILQSTPAIEPLIRDDLAKAMALAIDLASLYGTGATGQPTGVSQQTGINEPAPFTAAVPTWAEVVALESAIAVDNALLGNLAYIIEPAMRGSLKTLPKETGFPIYVMSDIDNRLNGYNCATTSQVTSGDVFFGNWNDLIIGFWGGLDITLDPYTKALAGSIRLIALQSCDIAVRHPVSFAFNNDTI